MRTTEGRTEGGTPEKRSKREQGKRDSEAAEEAAKCEANGDAVWTARDGGHGRSL